MRARKPTSIETLAAGEVLLSTEPARTEPVTPRPAATLICLRDDPAAGLEVLMTVRHQAMAFGSGALVFPGGRVEAADRTLAEAPGLIGPLPADVSPDEAALRVAAIRETFEEAGLLFARHAETGETIDDRQLQDYVAQYRPGLCAGQMTFATMLERENLVLATDALVRFAHWVTPKVRPKRFDTHFFLAAAPPGQVAGHDDGEAVESVWIAPGRAIAETETGRFKLLFATRMNLMKVDRVRDTEAALAAARTAPIVPVEPDWVKGADGAPMIRIPAEADYGGALFPAIDPPAM